MLGKTLRKIYLIPNILCSLALYSLALGSRSLELEARARTQKTEVDTRATDHGGLGKTSVTPALALGPT